MTINGVEFAVDCLDIIQELQTQLRLNEIPLIQKIVDTPNNIQICCPYHGNGQERRPSAGIKKTDGTFHCFACGEVHTLPEVISYCFGHTDDIVGRQGFQWLLKNFATISIEERKSLDLDLCRELHKDDMLAIQSISEAELYKYRYYHPYWKKRGIVDERIIELFDLGADIETDCITMPNFDKDGKCVFVARRSVRGKFFSYPSSSQKIVYGIYQLYRIKPFPQDVWITESMIDCLYLWQFGKYACALNGLGTEKQFEDLREMPCRHFILATDMDKAGQNARTKLKRELHNKIVTEVFLPKGRKDINDCTPEEIRNLVERMI